MTDVPIDAGLVERIRVRLRDDWRRTGDGDYTRMPDAHRRTLPGNDNPLATLLLDAVRARQAPVEPLKAPEPLTAAQISKVERSLGFALPAQLRQVYLEIGDGGFGPYGGIRRLSNWAADYAKLLEQTPVERGRPWPDGLLPIVYANGRRICVERDSGRVVLWTKPPRKVSEAKWLASFVPQADSVEEWLAAWVDTPTAVEGGPEGGWTPPAAEAQRRSRVEAEAAARRDAEAATARMFTPATLPPLPEELLGRVRTRAQDPSRRTHLSGIAAHAAALGPEDLQAQLQRGADAMPEQAVTGLGGILAGLQRLRAVGDLPGLRLATGPGGGMAMLRSGDDGTLGSPADESALDRAGEQLGVPLPEPLRQLLRIADGGYGPGSGLLGVTAMVALYQRLNARPPGPGGEPWPARLLPIWQSGEEIGCLDLESGAVTTYDPARMADIHGGYWRRSFATGHPSLEALLEEWLASPTFSEQAAAGPGNTPTSGA